MGLATTDLTEGSSPLTRGKPMNNTELIVGARLIPAHAGKTHCATLYVIHVWAHPRSRGENGHTQSYDKILTGSSPLTRGKLAGDVVLTVHLRLIPAHAGKTGSSTPSSRTTPAHPRSRGENTVFNNSADMGTGSSPLTRGKPRWVGGCRRPMRLIPAHAGKTPPQRTASRSTAAHPRSRGENGSASLWMYGGAGSSPLTRGKLACA